jgi:hypothetical protein
MWLLVEAGFGVAIEPQSSILGQQMKIKAIALSQIPQKANMTMLWLKERETEFKAFFESLN